MMRGPWPYAMLALSVAGCSKSDPAKPGADGPRPDPHGCLAATISHHEHTDDRDGVEHDVHYKERFVRCGDRVWTERILPRGVPGEAAHGHEHHAMPATYTMARLVVRTHDDEATLAMVSRAERRIIAVTPESYDAARFDGTFDAAAHILSSRAIATMPRLEGREAPVGAEWHGRSGAAGAVRVLWSKLYDIPLRIESESEGAAKRDTIELALEPPPLASDLPWAGLDAYEKKSDMDYMD
ncbi:hypothetical protein LVJ94_23040 [Pendulispora rubella]|uniref:Lipoprotein n=1 Tax=Pendulispora rubella TaxID=2741070 RepID=A0ABZ2LLP9_9BACT